MCGQMGCSPVFPACSWSALCKDSASWFLQLVFWLVTVEPPLMQACCSPGAGGPDTCQIMSADIMSRGRTWSQQVCFCLQQNKQWCKQQSRSGSRGICFTLSLQSDPHIWNNVIVFFCNSFFLIMKTAVSRYVCKTLFYLNLLLIRLFQVFQVFLLFMIWSRLIIIDKN